MQQYDVNKNIYNIYADDTVTYFESPGCFLRCLGKNRGKMEFWDLEKGLHQTAEAPFLFKEFIEGILSDWDFDNICAAHCGNVIGGAKGLLSKTLVENTPVLDRLSEKWRGNTSPDTSKLS